MARVAAIQLNSTADVASNLTQAEVLIAQAKKLGATLVVLPEMFAIVGAKPHDKLQVQEPLGHGMIQQFLSHQAQQHNIWLLGGTIPLTSNHPDKALAASLLYDPQGQLAAHYNKIHMFDVQLSDSLVYQESATMESGNNIVTVDTDIGKLGLSVCYDLRFPELFRAMSAQGALVFAIPSAFTYTTGEAHWEALLRARAIENFTYVIAPNQTGVHADGRRTYGHSMIIDPWGKILAVADKEEPTVLIADIDLAYLRSCREKIPALLHRKL